MSRHLSTRRPSAMNLALRGIETNSGPAEIRAYLKSTRMIVPQP